jgi:hypothetical protein
VADQNEIKKLLDDPNVTPDTKKQLVAALAGAGASDEDVERYAKANGVEVPSDPGIGSHLVGLALAVPTAGLSEAYVVGKEMKRSDWEKKGGDADKLVSKAKEEQELGSTQKVLNEQGDVPNSNTLLDAGAPGLRFFEKFIPVYAKAAPACGYQGAAPDLKNDIYRNYDEVRDIDFAKFREDAHKLDENVRALQNHDNALGSAWNGLGSWEGAAAEAARGYHDKFASTSKTFVGQMGGAPGAITGGVTNIQKLVKEFAQHVHDQYSEKCGGLTVEEAETAIRHANGDIYENDGGILDWLSGVPGPIFGAVLGAVTGGPLGMLAGLGWGSWIENTRNGIINDAKEKLKALCQEFDSKKKAFDGFCQAVQQGVDGSYTAMFTGLNQAAGDDPFGKVGDPPAFTGEGGGNGRKPGGGGTPPGGGGTPPGGGGTPPGGGGTPEVPKPENPLDKNGDGKPDVPGDTDGDGKVDDFDGDGKPDHPAKHEEKLESVTVKAGDNTIKVTEPDSNGHVKMTIDTPKGEPKTYDLDFSKNPEAAKALMGQNGTQAITNMANTLTGTTPSNQTAPGAPGSAAGTPAPGGGAVPATGAPGSESNPIPVEVGADGKIHIEQDGVNFTAAVDPSTGEINLTADNGDGTPDQIGVSFGEDENPAGQTHGSTAGGGGEGGQGGVAGPRLDDGLRLPESDFPQAVPAEGGVTTTPAGAEFHTMPAPASAAEQQVWSPPGQDTAPSLGERFHESVGRGYIEDNGIMPSAGEHRISVPDGPLHAQHSDSTMTSGVSFTSHSGSGSESVLGSSSPDGAWNGASQGDSGSGLGTNPSEAGQPGSANLPSMQDASHGQAPSGAPAGGMMGGGMMGGGMMGGAGGGQQGGDSERGASQWRTTGTLFDDDNSNPLSSMQPVLGDERGEAVNPWR